MAGELGGHRFAKAIACIGSLCSLIYLAENTTYSMNSFDVLFWTLTAYLLIQLSNTGQPKYWILLGLTLGFGLLNKIGVLWLGFGIFTGLILTPQRTWLKTRWPYLAALIAALLFLPYILWNMQHDMASVEFMRHATGEKYSTLNVFSFLAGQLLLQNPASVILWAAGLVFFLFLKQGEKYRLIGFIYLAACAILIVNGHSKAEYLGPAYGMLFAGGGVALEQWLEKRGSILKPIYAAIIILSAILFAPAVIPILPVESYIRYADALGIKPSTEEHKELGQLPQFYADMFGWKSKADAVAKAYHALTPEEQKVCAIFADNYGRCAALDFFGKKYGLPPAIGNHNNYWIWDPGVIPAN